MSKHHPSGVLETLPRSAGVGLHFSSLPNSHGIGDIGDTALRFVDDLVHMGISVWQFLPTGPTAYGNSPYQPLSAFAGNELLIGLGPLIQQGLLEPDEVDGLSLLPRDRVDFEQLIPAKRAVLMKAVERFQDNRPSETNAAYEQFLHENAAQWLNDYALFRVLKSRNAERPWPAWEPALVHREPATLEAACESYRDEIEQVRILQFLFSRQWGELRAYANQQGVRLFGDMPIYIALDSSDAWARRELLEVSADGVPAAVAGVPPDYFSEDGQLWGNPLYDWDFHDRSGYEWWIERVRHAAMQSDLVRIDHFRGFEAYWSVPYGAETARTGSWEPGPRERIFRALNEALGDLPIVAEDLGVITPEVDALRKGQGIPGMVVLQFALTDPEFDTDSIETNSVCYTGTHDNDTSVGWFKGGNNDTLTLEEREFLRAQALRHTGGTPETIHDDMIRLALNSAARLAVIPMQDFLGLGSEARFNIPGTTMNNWQWRMTPDQLGEALQCSIAQRLNDSRRNA